MNKSELVAIMAEKASLSKKDAEGTLNAFVDAVKDAVSVLLYSGLLLSVLFGFNFEMS